jgi:hypothetical protein
VNILRAVGAALLDFITEWNTPLLIFFGVLCVTYYWLTTGWWGALAGLLSYAAIVMAALWFF